MRVYINDDLATNQKIELIDAQFNHIVRVMRKKIGDKVSLFNGKGGEYSGAVVEINKKSLVIKLDEFKSDNKDSSLNIHLIQSFAKFDKMDFVFQKAVELGVNRITPFMSEHSSFKLPVGDKQDKKIQHWQGIIESACEQCGMNLIPKLTEFASLKNIQHYLQADTQYLILSPTADQSLGSLIKNQQDQHSFGVIIGPEGGFSESEMLFFGSHNACTAVKLGQRILRTETASLAVISSLHAIFGDWLYT